VIQSEAAALQMLAALLGGSSTTSVLERRLNFEEGIALSAWAGYNSMMRDYGMFSVGIAPVDGVTLDRSAKRQWTGLLPSFCKNGVDLDQFERVRRQIRASEIYALDDAQGRARQFGVGLSIGLSVEDVEGWIDSAGSGHARGCDRGWRAACWTVAPAVTGYLTQPAKRGAKPMKIWIALFVLLAAPLRAEVDDHACDLALWAERVAGGGTFHSLCRAGSDLCRGATLDSDAQAGAVNLMTSLLSEGAGEMDAQAFAARSEELATRLSFSAGRDSISVSVPAS
jgi:hypothetical protein